MIKALFVLAQKLVFYTKPSTSIFEYYYIRDKVCQQNFHTFHPWRRYVAQSFFQKQNYAPLSTFFEF